MALLSVKPLHLLAINSSGKWEVNEEVVANLNTVTRSISVTTIVGKSFLMNKLAGIKSGFHVGGTIEMTKGIWMRQVKHPKQPDCCVLLLDTEGLLDMQKGYLSYDMQLFTFALLLSNCILFNADGTNDSYMLNVLRVVAELCEHIKIMKDADKDEKVYFRTQLPSLCVVFRDSWKMEVNGQQVAPNEYLEWLLKLRKGTSSEDQTYNSQAECLRHLFPKRRCFALPKPVSDDTKLLDLENVPDSDFSSEFLQRADELVEAVYDEARPLVLNGNRLTGASFVSLLRKYVRASNDGEIPCVEPTFDVMTAEQCRKAKMAASSLRSNESLEKICQSIAVKEDLPSCVQVMYVKDNKVCFEILNGTTDQMELFLKTISNVLDTEFISVEEKSGEVEFYVAQCEAIANANEETLI